jgi:hypothetical protein
MYMSSHMANTLLYIERQLFLFFFFLFSLSAPANAQAHLAWFLCFELSAVIKHKWEQ